MVPVTTPPDRASPGDRAELAPTTGVAALDALIDGPRISDNLVVLAEDDEPLGRITAAFVAANAAVRPVVVARTHAATSTITPADIGGGGEHGRTASGVTANVEVLDWHAIDGSAAAAQALRQADERLGAGAAYVVDSLSGLAARCGDDAALELFLATCPHLYERRSIALWPVRADRHRPAVLARLAAITQVVLEVSERDGDWHVEVQQAAGRPEPTVGRRVRLRPGTAGLDAVGPITSGRERLGAMVRTSRTTRGLSQAELARRIGISPSALSQVERGVRGLSGESLMRVWEALDVPFGPSDTRLRGYRVARRGGHANVRTGAGVEVRTVLDDPVAGSVHRVSLAPGTRGRGPLFATKGDEVVVVLAGVVDLEVGGHPETLQAGDALVVTDATVGAWTNPAEEAVDLVWMVRNTPRARGGEEVP
jgi:DNA-binding XRE family transcriptional regulator/quercetin dioxygenase-like cupin family protein